MAKVLVLHGPNLNLLGQREPGIYGSDTLSDINARCVVIARELGHEAICAQHNGEGELIDRLHRARQEGVAFVVLNPAGYTHTSVALRDALLSIAIPFIEVHLSNPKAREAFRHHSYFSDIAVGVISGFGAQSYELAMRAACARIGH